MDKISTININDYTIQNKLGQGGFGEVFKAKEKSTGNIYAAKISFKSLEDNSEETLLYISREVNILSKIHHPSIIKFIGYSSINAHNEPKPVIMMEYLPNGTLFDILDLERRSLASLEWDSTKKLINIYGIASALLYLHQHKIVHRDLKSSNILMDEFLCPKLGDFGLSKIQHLDTSTSFNSSSISAKGTPLYMSPEIWNEAEYSEASDVYAFSIIVYEIVTTKIPFLGCSSFEIGNKVTSGIRPEIDVHISMAYRNLIERCWSQEAKDRPTFSEIVDILKTDEEFLVDLNEKEDFFDYIDYIDDQEKGFESSKCIIPIDQFIKRKTKTFKRISIKNHIKNEDKIIYPPKGFKKLNKNCQNLVEDAENDNEKMFQLGTYLIEGINDFPKNTDLGIRYLEKSISQGNINSAIYFCRMLIDAELIPQDLSKAERILNDFNEKENSNVSFLLGLIHKKKMEFTKAFECFEISATFGNGEAQFQLGKLYYKGLGCTKNIKEAKKLFSMSKINGCNKSDKFLLKHKMNESEEEEAKSKPNIDFKNKEKEDDVKPKQNIDFKKKEKEDDVKPKQKIEFKFKEKDDDVKPNQNVEFKKERKKGDVKPKQTDIIPPPAIPNNKQKLTILPDQKPKPAFNEQQKNEKAKGGVNNNSKKTDANSSSPDKKKKKSVWEIVSEELSKNKKS